MNILFGLLVLVLSEADSGVKIKQVSQDMGIEAPIPLSTKLGDFSNIFHRIVRAADHPHLSIPETSAGKSRKQYHRLLNRSLVCISGIHLFSIMLILFLSYV